MIESRYSDLVICFDLDDTIFLERDFVFSGYSAICDHFSITDLQLMKQLFEEGCDNVLLQIERRNSKVGVSINKMLEIYRSHEPRILPRPNVTECLRTLKLGGSKLVCITDGRSLTQRNKIRALDIEKYFDCVLVSEETGFDKKSNSNFKKVMSLFENTQYMYIGDNFEKDFVEPKKLGWFTMALYPNPSAIRCQRISEYPAHALPDAYFDSFFSFLPTLENLIFSKR